MPKKTETEIATEATTGTERKVEANFFAEKDGFPCHVKITGDVEVLDDLEVILESFQGKGYTPGKGNGGNGGHSAQGGGGGGQNGARPTSFDAPDGSGRWYINASKKAQGKFYVARKGQNGYEYYKGEIPADIKAAYGASL